MSRIEPTFALLVLLGVAGCTADTDPDSTSVPDCTAGQQAEVCDVFQLVNQERVNANLAPYAYNRELGVAAQLHAEDMVANNYFDHRSLDGRSFADRCVGAGYDASPRGENIARGQQSPDQVMADWMSSDGHRANILSADANEIGVGLDETTWVQVFGSR